MEDKKNIDIILFNHDDIKDYEESIPIYKYCKLCNVKPKDIIAHCNSLSHNLKKLKIKSN